MIFNFLAEVNIFMQNAAARRLMTCGCVGRAAPPLLFLLQVVVSGLHAADSSGHVRGICTAR